MRLADLADRRVAVWGFAREGRASLAALRRRFPAKALTVFCAAGELNDTDRRDDVAFVTDKPDANALAQFDVVIKSPGISFYQSPVPEAQAAGVRFTSGSALWFAENPDANTICVTGTKGKSTVTALIAHLLRKGGSRVALAGNIGLPLLELLDPPQPPDWWVIELSSFQTRDFDGAPRIAVVNNLYEEHLDWHVTRERYVADKLRITERARHVVVPAEPVLMRATAAENRTLFDDVAGWHIERDTIFRGAQRAIGLDDVPLPGAHNAHNVCAALAAIDAARIDALPLVPHVRSFRALPHRLQPLGERDGIRYINDSISTTPYASVEALRSVQGRPTTILVGGFDRGVSWRVFAEHVAAQPPHAIVTMGANGDAIGNAIAAALSFQAQRTRTLAAAFARAREITPAGGVILLSPGAPSFDQFRDYAERGREFARLAGFDPARIAQIEGLGIA